MTTVALPLDITRSASGGLNALLPAFAVLVFALAMAAPALAQSMASADGEAVYRERCAGCHEAGAARAPDLATLRQMSPDWVLGALQSGSMSTQGQGLSNAQLGSLIRFVAGAAPVQGTALERCLRGRNPIARR